MYVLFLSYHARDVHFGFIDMFSFMVILDLVFLDICILSCRI